MGDFKVKFRPSTVSGRAGTLFYQVIHDRQVRTISTVYKLYPEEWDGVHARVVVGDDDSRYDYLFSVQQCIVNDMRRLETVIKRYAERPVHTYCVADLVKAFKTVPELTTFVAYGTDLAARLCQQGRERTSETYLAALRSFQKFCNGHDVLLEEMDVDLMKRYEFYLKRRHLMMNTVSFYMRVLRAMYNSAVEQNLTEQRFPFRRVYTGIGKTVKRAVSLQVIRRIKNLDLSDDNTLAFARDIFLFSFYMRGMSFVDIAFLRKDNLVRGILSYRRRKTGQQLFIKWEPCMQGIVDRYTCVSSSYLLPIIRCEEDGERKQYLNALYAVNRGLKEVARRIRFTLPLTMYVARHSWASIAKSRHIPLSVISEGMGHDSEQTTQIYLNSLDTAEVDKANELILKLL